MLDDERGECVDATDAVREMQRSPLLRAYGAVGAPGFSPGAIRSSP
jgi:hypothetical protein